jgi:hypothetical protein
VRELDRRHVLGLDVREEPGDATVPRSSGEGGDEQGADALALPAIRRD